MKLIFTHLRPDIWQYKVASTLRKKGIKTVSVSLLTFNKTFNKAFDEIISPELENLKSKTILKEFFKKPTKFFKFFYKLITTKADVAICQGAPHYLSAFFIWLFKGRMPRIYFPYDMNFSRYKNPEKFELKRELWGEKYSFRNCDAIIIKSTKKELELLPNSFNVKNKPQLVFPCYVLNDWLVPYQPKKKISYFDKSYHIALTGNIADESFPYAKPMYPYFTEILKQKIHLHIYTSQKLSEEQTFKITLNNKNLQSYLHIHEFVPPDKLSKEIAKYDFGYYFGKYSENAKPNSEKFSATASKIANYFESFLPVIVFENLLASKIIKENYLGISLKEIKNLKKEIKKFNHKKAIKNIEKFRTEYSVENHIDELIDFVKSLK